MAFRLFLRLYSNPSAENVDQSRLRSEISAETKGYLSRFVDMDERMLLDPSEEEWHETRALCTSLEKFVVQQNPDNLPVVKSPVFRGCGFVDECTGDLIIGNQLVEVKAGDRSFRATDIRQLLVYCALNS